MAVVLTWVLFLVWSVIGLAVLRLGRHRWSLATLLLAPTVGFAALTVPTYMLVRAGLPVRATAVPVGATLLAVSAVTLWRLRPTRAKAARLWKRSRAFLAILVAAFGLSAWPMFGYGFDWVANGNDDMANYCLVATGYRDHGYVHAPTAEELIEGRDPTQAYWFFYILLQVRSGAETLLAVDSVWTGLPAQPVFMPTIVALHLCLVCAAGGLAVVGAGRRAAVLATALLAVSGASAYGIVWQLIAQVGGLALLCTALALVSARFRRVRARVLLGRAGACGLVFAGLLAFYPEVIPILVGGCVVLGIRELLRRRLDRRHLAHAGAAIAVMAALLPVYLYGAARFMAEQAQQGGKGSDTAVEVFPFFMTPQGPALFWGFLNILGPEPPGARDGAIVLGFVLLAAVLVATAAGVRASRASAAALCVIALMTAALYQSRAAFGLFKIAMFAQPFLWAVVGAWVAGRRGRWSAATAAALVLVVGGLNARTQFWYVDQSRGAENRVEVPALTARRGLSEFRAEYARRGGAGEVDRVLLATENNVLMKLLAAEVRGVPVEESGVGPLTALARTGLSYTDVSPWLQFHPGWRDQFVDARRALEARAERDRPRVLDPDTGAELHRPMHPPPDRGAGPPERVLVVAGSGAVSVFNRYQYPKERPPVVCAPLSDLRNFAVFCDATGARQHYLGMGEPDAVALYQLETDPFFRKSTMTAVGRALVLDVFNPDPQVRVLVGYTSSFKADPARRAIPDLRVVGDRRSSFGSVGIGAARLVSPPLGTQSAGPGRFLALSFGEPDRNANIVSGLEALWGADLPRDRRRLTGHLRDVSILSEAEYAAFVPPERVTVFPADLGHPHLEFSGLCEDGWVGATFKVRLTQAAPGQEAVIRGQIPLLPDNPGFRTTAVVRVDGRVVETRTLGQGEFEVRAPGGTAPGPRWVEVAFSDAQTLPAPDGRRAVAHLRFVGFEPRDEIKSRPPERLASFPADLRHPKAEALGLFEDGWCMEALSARLWQPGAGAAVVVRGSVPKLHGVGDFRTEVQVLLDGTEVARKELGPGAFEVRVPAGNGAQARRLECRFTHTQTLPAPDGRRVGAHLQFVGFEPPAPGQ